VTGFTLDELDRRGTPATAAMAAFARWIDDVTPPGSRPVFVGYPVAFDWMFVAYYFHRFRGHNPFGVAGLDLSSFHAGMIVSADLTNVLGRLDPLIAAQDPLTHNALDDALAQARVFEQLLAERGHPLPPVARDTGAIR